MISYTADASTFVDSPDTNNTPLIPNAQYSSFTGPFTFPQIVLPSPNLCGSTQLSHTVKASIEWDIDVDDKDAIFHLLTQSTLILASDGGHYHSGSFAWVVATSSETIIAHGQGLVSGTLALMSSFRAEAAGLLHGLIAVGHILRHCATCDNRLLDTPHLFTNDELSPLVNVYSDSKSLITRRNDWRTYNDLYPSVGLACDSDFCLEIIGILKNEFQHANISMSHVRGHQDEKKPWDGLTWPEKLNVTATNGPPEY